MEWTKRWKAEGKAEGRDAERRALAQRLLGRGMSVAEVAELVDLPVPDVEAIGRE